MVNVYNHSNNVCDISRNPCTLLFNLYMQYYNIAFLLISLENYNSYKICTWYILKLHWILILDTLNWVMSLVIYPLALQIQKQGKYK